MKTAKKIKNLLEEKLGVKGIKLVQNNGVFQDVKHYHLHLIPDCNVQKMELDDVFEILTK
jgi:diadenosine tetraphosphate (Ap4A) HIT family hydrolase